MIIVESYRILYRCFSLRFINVIESKNLQAKEFQLVEAQQQLLLTIVQHWMFNKLENCLYSQVGHPLMNRFLRESFGCLCCTIKFNMIYFVMTRLTWGNVLRIVSHRIFNSFLTINTPVNNNFTFQIIISTTNLSQQKEF